METSTTTSGEGLTERLELLGSMTDEDVRSLAAFAAEYSPRVFDAAVAELLDTDDEDLDDDEPFCATCGAAAGIFIGRGENWLHYTGQGTVKSPVQLFDPGHEPVIAWRPAVAR
jgi:hypothetical protein